jgi:predicted RNase H-like HicB family nuclease
VRYAIVIEDAGGNYSAYVPDLPGCVATGATVQETEHAIREAKGPVPRLAEIIADEPIKGSWWSHPKSHQIYAVFQALSESNDILVCRLVDGKVTFVHRRLWPALVRVAAHFSVQQLSRVHEEHTAAGHHVSHEVAFPEWVPPEAIREARLLDEQEALKSLGLWAEQPNKSLRARRRKAARP